MMPLQRLRARIGVRRRPDRLTLLLATLAVAGAALVMARQVGYGVGLVADAPTYLAVADSLRAGMGFTQFSVYPYLLWPPLYPTLLAASSLFVLDPHDVAGPLNAGVFGLTIFVVGHCLRRYLRHRFLVVGASLAVMLSIPLASLAAAAITEPLFILLTTLALAQAARFWYSGKGWELALAAALVGLALLTRYTGIVVALAILPALVLQRGVGHLEKAKRIGLYCLIAGLPTALWLLRNQLAYGRIRSEQYSAPYSLAEAMEEVGNDLAGWALRYNPDSSTAAVFAWIVLAALAAGVIYALARAYTHRRALSALVISAPADALPDTAPGGARHSRRCANAGCANGGGCGFWGLCAGFALAYLVFLVAVKAGINPQDWGGRYLAPAYIPLLVTVVFALDRLLIYAARRNWRWAAGELPIISAVTAKGGMEMARLPAIGVALALCAWLAWGAAQNVRDIKASNFYGTGLLSSRERANSEVLQYLRRLPVGSIIYSNSASVYLHTDHTEGYRIVPSSILRSPVRPALRNIADAPDGAYLAWFYDWERRADFRRGVPAVRRTPGLEPVAELADGFVLKVNREYAPATDYYRAAYASVAAGDYGAPAARAVYDIYHAGNTLLYVREPCAAADLEAMFLLHLIPADAGDLPRHRHDDGFDNRDFGFQKYGVAFDGICVVVVPLPDYDLDGIRTGQYIPDTGRLWTAEFIPTDYYRVAYARLTAGDYGAPAARAAYDIYQNGNRLIYARETCTASDIETLFFLHLTPEDTDDLPADRWEYGYGNRDFDFREYGAAFDGICLAIVPLPDYDLAGVRTGQFVPGAGRLWTAEFAPAGKGSAPWWRLR